ncbi:MAG: NAD(P)/FAD-dependent oxidoreductase [Bacteroidales bacterium]|nr:NAD(P)/FAD-dependent oxidoreductase [Bacteroidales bacterium]
MSDNKKVVIIGSGLGGLSCGVILAKNGYQVTVLEKGTQVGGCLQCFSRRGAKFETGMHFVGSAAKGQTLDRWLNYLEVSKDITLSPLDTSCYERVLLKGQEYKFPNSHERFVEQFSEYFPKEKDNLEKYFSLVENIFRASMTNSLRQIGEEDAIVKYRLQSVNDVLDSLFEDKLLKNVLLGNSPLYAAEKDKTPFSMHAYIMGFYNASAFRIVGGSDKIAFSLKSTIEKYGGKVLTNARVSEIVCKEFKATGVMVNDTDFYQADYVISDVHPEITLSLIKSNLIRPAFRHRISSLPQTTGVFSVYVQFKENTVPYMNSNFYGYHKDTVWDCEKYTEDSWPENYLYMHFCSSEKQQYAASGVILAYMRYSEVLKWEGTTLGRRGEDYEEFKKQKAEKLLSEVENDFPGLKNSVKYYYTSTPLTYVDYTGTKNGSMYGIAKDVRLGAACRVLHRLRIPNVFQAGQNINAHGILGVIVGSLVTCSEFLTAQTIYQQIEEAN